MSVLLLEDTLKSERYFTQLAKNTKREIVLRSTLLLQACGLLGCLWLHMATCSAHEIKAASSSNPWNQMASMTLLYGGGGGPHSFKIRPISFHTFSLLDAFAICYRGIRRHSQTREPPETALKSPSTISNPSHTTFISLQDCPKAFLFMTPRTSLGSFNHFRWYFHRCRFA